MKLPGLSGEKVHTGVQRGLYVAWAGGALGGYFVHSSLPIGALILGLSAYLSLAILPAAEKIVTDWIEQFGVPYRSRIDNSEVER